MDDLILDDENEYLEIGEFILHANEEKETTLSDNSYENLVLNTEIDNDKSEQPEELYEENDYYINQPTQKTSSFNIWLISISLILLVTIAVLCVCIFYVPTTLGTTPTAYLQDIFETLFS